MPTVMASCLGQRFFRRDPVTLAKALLGQRLVRVTPGPNGKRLAGLIVEVEAYLGLKDQAAHTFDGRRTPRNESMWQHGGLAYVYFTYGMHHCMNVVASVADDPVAVLIRALEPTEGLPQMRKRRKAARRDTDLCSGPAKLCQALAIDRKLDAHDLTAGRSLLIEHARKTSYPASQITRGPRVGVSYAKDWADKPLRFYLTHNPHVSKAR